MDRFKNILVAASPGHLEALTMRAAVKLADTNHAHLTVLDVVPPVPRLRRMIEVEGRVIDIEAALVRDRTERLRHLVENTRADADTDVIVTIGEPFLEVIRHVLAHGNDLVMVGSVPDPESDIMHLLRKCPVPVWVMRPSRARTLRLLALIDPDQDDPVRDGLNDLVLELAVSLAQRENADLHIGHAWALEGESTLRSSPYVSLPGPMVDVMADSVESSHREQLDALMERHRVIDEGAEVHMLVGDPRRVLPGLADRLDIGLIVMGTVARTGLSGLIMGNTAESILRSVTCSVLAVKPEGFVTPVKPGKGDRMVTTGE